MNKRMISFLLAAVLLLSLIPGAARIVHADDALTTSEECIELLKRMEGFVEKPYYDNGQYSVGYGCACDKDDYPDGITKEEADALLREYLVDMEKSLNSFARKNGLTFSQNQFDALMLFTYNCGIAWMYGEGAFRDAVASEAQGNDFLYAIARWSSASGQMNLALVKRRLIEAGMYLNNSYTGTKPANFTYVLFNANEGITEVNLQAYDSNTAGQVKPIPTRTGYRFLGWYTAEESGSWVTTLTDANSEQTLVAHWQEGNGDPVNGTAANYQRTASQLRSLHVYAEPGGSAIGGVDEDARMTIIADYVDSSGNKWGKLQSGVWVNLGNPLIGIVTEVTQNNGVTVTVTGTGVNVRSAPGTDSEVLTMVTAGDQIVITETKLVGNDLWGKFNSGWICLLYTNYSAITSGSNGGSSGNKNEENTKVIATGTVVNCNSLRIRSDAGLSYPTVGSLDVGTRVEITQKKTANGMTWGKISNGWISLSYVKLDPESKPEPPTEPAEKPSSGSTQTNTEPNATVSSQTALNIRSGPGTSYARVGSYNPGTEICILEKQTANGVSWGRTDKGWVCMTYIKMNSASSGTAGSTTEGITGTVTASALNVRASAGSSGRVVGYYYKGNVITITEQKQVSGMTWGKTEKGWVSMSYVQLNSNGTTTEPSVNEDDETITGIVTASALYIRRGAGTNNAIVGTYTKGTKVTILETVKVGNTTWGRTENGWISMAYVQT